MASERSDRCIDEVRRAEGDGVAPQKLFDKLKYRKEILLSIKGAMVGSAASEERRKIPRSGPGTMIGHACLGLFFSPHFLPFFSKSSIV